MKQMEALVVVMGPTISMVREKKLAASVGEERPGTAGHCRTHSERLAWLGRAATQLQKCVSQRQLESLLFEEPKEASEQMMGEVGLQGSSGRMRLEAVEQVIGVEVEQNEVSGPQIKAAAVVEELQMVSVRLPEVEGDAKIQGKEEEPLAG